ncbi:major histocompatibility complex class I-related gene protein-like [Gadus chalcogrammus]|uniref:major histocompatibility complex class I-related gene protein-like n=1 Tax=Gadus chalcogrammus TaxID=1042646 RepID=UPI0024C4D3F9|nr:major histocompatibility complex class I-related gene protein-like [Gadus chalcogrammus]
MSKYGMNVCKKSEESKIKGPWAECSVSSAHYECQPLTQILELPGAHIVQRMSGCEWDDEDDTTDGYRQFAYDGENFLALDLKTLTWVAPVRQAVPSKLRLDQDRAYNQHKKNYYTKVCVDWLKKHLAYGKSTLQRTGRVT